jgi:tRNA (cmo5U34)-methyltransferase
MNDNKTAHKASEYDANIEKSIPFYRTFHSEVLRMVAVCKPSPRSWLDTGCGTGGLVLQAAARFPAAAFRLCDPSKEMLEIAAAKNSDDRVQAIGCFESSRIPAEYDGAFDVVTAIQAHHYQDRMGREASTRRCFELLEDGGLFFTFENTSPLTREGEGLFKEYWKRYQVEAGKDEETARKHVDRYGVEFFPISVPEHIESLQAAGFSTVELFWYSYMQSGYLCVK